MRALLIATLALATAGCTWLAEPCPCGRSFERDPWTDEPALLGTDHSIGVHCVCQCGEDERVLEDPSAQCERYERACTTAAGESALYTCR